MTDIAATAARLAAIEPRSPTHRRGQNTAPDARRRRRGRRHHPEHRRHPCTVSHPAAALSNPPSPTPSCPTRSRQACTKQVIDGAAVKKLSPALWEQCCTQGEPFLTRAAS